MALSIGMTQSNAQLGFRQRPASSTDYKTELINSAAQSEFVQAYESIVKGFQELTKDAVVDGELIDVKDNEVNATLLGGGVNRFWNELGYNPNTNSDEEPIDWQSALSGIDLSPLLVQLKNTNLQNKESGPLVINSPLFRIEVFEDLTMKIHPVTWEINQTGGVKVWAPKISDTFAVVAGNTVIPVHDSGGSGRNVGKKKRPNNWFRNFAIIAGSVAMLWYGKSVGDKQASVPPVLPHESNAELQATEFVLGTPVNANGADVEFATPSPSMTAVPVETEKPSQTPSPTKEKIIPKDFVVSLKDFLKMLGNPGTDSPYQQQSFSPENRDYNPEAIKLLFEALCSGGNVEIQGLKSPIKIEVYKGGNGGMRTGDMVCDLNALINSKSNFIARVQINGANINLPGTYNHVPDLPSTELFSHIVKSGGKPNPTGGRMVGLSQFSIGFGGHDAIAQYVNIVGAEDGMIGLYPEIVKDTSVDEDLRFTIPGNSITSIVIWPIPEDSIGYKRNITNFIALTGNKVTPESIEIATVYAKKMRLPMSTYTVNKIHEGFAK